MGPSAVNLHDYMQNMAGLKEVRLKGGKCTSCYGSGSQLVIVEKKVFVCAIGIYQGIKVHCVGLCVFVHQSEKKITSLIQHTFGRFYMNSS